MAVQNWGALFQPNDPSLYFKKKPGSLAAAQGLQQTLADATPIVQGLIEQKKAAKAQKDWEDSVDSWAQQNPQFASMAPIIKKDKALAGQLLPGMMKQMAPKPPQWKPESGRQTKEGMQIFYDPSDPTKEKLGSIPAKASSYGATMAPIRQAQYTLQDLPSNQGPNTAAGAAYQVKVAARQGKSLIAKATNPQAISLSSADLGRAVQRSAPLAETIGASNFADNLTTKWNLLTQKLTADPNSKDIPKIRREVYNMFDELDKAATPWVKNQLDYMDEEGFKVSKDMRKKQMGEELPDIPFIDLTGQTNTQPSAGGYSDPGKEARYQQWLKTNGK